MTFRLPSHFKKASCLKAIFVPTNRLDIKELNFTHRHPKRFIGSISLLLASALFSYPTSAQPAEKADAAIYEILSKETGQPVTSMEFFRTASAPFAWKAFAEAYLHIPDSEDFVKRAGRAIAENTTVESYVRTELRKLPHSRSSSEKRGYLIAPLSRIPAPWSLQIIGYYLTEKTPFVDDQPWLDYGSTSNSEYALVALSQMGFSDAPGSDIWSSSSMKALRDWWEANKNRVDERIREINPGYYRPRPLASGSTPSTTPGESVLRESAATAATTPIPSATPMTSATPVLAESANQRAWGIYWIGGLVALAALAALGWAIRKRK